MHRITSLTAAIAAAPRRLTGKSRLRRVGIALLAGVAATGAGLASQATAQPGTIKVTGHLQTHIADVVDCDAPTGVCFSGDIAGVLSGSIEGKVSTIAPTAEPDVALLDAATTIHTSDGDLHFAHEHAVYRTTPDGKGEFSWLMQITSGTGRYAGATGVLRGTGLAPPAPGATTTSTYVGEITLG
jgi:hypothetical protein